MAAHIGAKPRERPMSDHGHHDHGAHADEHHGDEHLEVFPDSGITETSKPIFKWLYVVYAAFILYFHWFVGSVFWFQEPNNPKWGAGWQAAANVEKPNHNWSFSGQPHGMASTLLNGDDPSDVDVKNREASVYHNPYGARR